jgi:hypothetical protein
MFLKYRERRKDGKVQRSWSIVESRRYARHEVAHRYVLHLGEIPNAGVALLLARLNLVPPLQPPPKIRAPAGQEPV